MGNVRYKTIAVQIDELVSISPTSYRVRIDGRTLFLPTSQCRVDEDDMTAEVPMWLVEKEGLEGYIVE